MPITGVVKNKWRITLSNLAPGFWFGIIIGVWHGYTARNPFANSDRPIDWAMISTNPLVPYLYSPKYESFVWSIIPLVIIGLVYRVPASYLENITATKTKLGGTLLRAFLKGWLASCLAYLILVLLGLLGAPSHERLWTLLYKELYGVGYVMGATSMNAAIIFITIGLIVSVFSLSWELVVRRVVRKRQETLVEQSSKIE